MNGQFTEVMYKAREAMDEMLRSIRIAIAQQKAIDDMKGKRNIYVKFPIIRTYNRKPLSRSIRNNLPQRIRINEKPML